MLVYLIILVQEKNPVFYFFPQGNLCSFQDRARFAGSHSYWFQYLFPVNPVSFYYIFFLKTKLSSIYILYQLSSTSVKSVFYFDMVLDETNSSYKVNLFLCYCYFFLMINLYNQFKLLNKLKMKKCSQILKIFYC